jgi:hypothetical protein
LIRVADGDPSTSGASQNEGRSTLPEDNPLDNVRRSRAIRRIGLGLLLIIVVMALLGWAGPRPTVASAEATGYRLEVSHPSVARPGLAIRLSIVVSREGGFDQPVRLILLREYIEALDFNAIYPDASAQIAEDGYVIWEFDPPEGDSLTVDFDGRHEPGAEGMVNGSIGVLDQGERAVEVQFSTLVLP